MPAIIQPPKPAKASTYFKVGDRVRVRKRGGGLGENVWEIVTLDRFTCTIREAGTAFVAYPFEIADIDHADGRALRR